MRKIPATMATQHPDNAAVPYWHSKAYISAAHEVQECFRCFSELGIQEYNWDWEGKFVDEAVVDRLYHSDGKFFHKHALGKDFFLTFRIPNPWVERQARLARAFMVMLTSASLARLHGVHTPPLFEFILPLTESADQLIELQDAFYELSHLKHPLLSFDYSLKQIEVIPLFESVQNITDSVDVLRRYIHLYKERFGEKPHYIRPYCARSDPALNSGLVPTVLSIKVALSRYKEFEKETNIKLFPMIGAGSLPFRGGVNPQTVKRFIDEYRGMRTTTIQSGFRYDYPAKSVKRAVEELNTYLPRTEARDVSALDREAITGATYIFEREYRMVIESIAPMIFRLASDMPKRRERHQHIGLFGYSRGFGEVKLPRAIPFTGMLYSFGVPPEFIGTGRGIKQAKESGDIGVIEKHYVHLKEELNDAGGYINKDVLKALSHDTAVFAHVLEDITCVEDYLGESLGPKTPSQKEHHQLTEDFYKAYKNKEDVGAYIEKMGILRKSLG